MVDVGNAGAWLAELSMEQDMVMTGQSVLAWA
jgi:hypothetical protein